MTRSLPVLLAVAVAGLSPALAQDVPTPPVTPPMCAPEAIQDEDDGCCEARTLSHLDGVGASTSLSVVKQGDAWHIELERVTLADEQGVASEQKLDVYVKSSHAVDQGLDALFREAPDDPQPIHVRQGLLQGGGVAGDVSQIPAQAAPHDPQG